MADKNLTQFPVEELSQNQDAEVALYQDPNEMLTQNDLGREVDLFQEPVEELTQNARGVELYSMCIEVLYIPPAAAAGGGMWVSVF
jgi:hypothetical protein